MHKKHLHCIIFGAGGHAKVVYDTILESKSVDVKAFIEKDEKLLGKRIWNCPIMSADSIPDLILKGVSHFVVGVGTVGNFESRIDLYNFGQRQGLNALTVIHPRAVCSKKAKIGQGTVVFALSVINASAEIGENVIINTGAIIEHDCIIGHQSHIATGAKLAGNVVVGHSTIIGAGAVIKQGISIGDNVIVGAGGVVVKNVRDNCVVAGSPAKPIS